MAGHVQWEAQVDSNVAKLLKETKDLRDQLDGIKKGNYEIKLNIDNEKLEKVISNLDKMLNSLGKGTGDFKEFENLSKQLNEIVSEVKELNKAFGGINDSGVSNLLSSIQSIDKSLSSLSEHITNVNKDFGSVGKNASDNVGQINEARKATEGLTEATKELANAQKNVGNKSNISSGNSENKALLEGEEIRKNLYKINSEIGMSEEDFISQLRKENEEIQKGNREFQERLTLLKDGKVVASYFGSKASMNIHSSDLDTAFDKVIHSHSPLEGSSVPSFEDLDLIFGKYKSDIKEFVLFYNNEMRSLQAPGDMSLLGSNFRDYGKFLDAISSLTSDSNVYSNYVNNYLASIAEEAGVAYKQVDELGNVINSKRINTSDWEIIVDVMRQLTNIHREENQDEIFRQIAEKGKGLSNTFIESKGAVEQFEVSVESLEKVLINLWKSVENDGGKTAFKQLQEQLVSLSSDDIKNILYGDEMFYDANGEADELKAVAEKIYNTYYLPLINAEKELQSVQSSTPPMKDTFQGDTKASAESSAPAVKEEAKAMEQVAENAEKASKGKDKFAKANKKVKESADSSSKAVNEEASEFNKIINKLDGYQKKLDKFNVKPTDGHRYPLYEDNINSLKKKIEELRALSQKDINLINEKDINDAKELQKGIDELIFKMNNMSAGEKGFDPLSADKALEKINSELKKNSAMSNEAKAKIKALYREIASGNPYKPIKDLLHEMYKLIQAERLAGREGKSFMDIFKEKVVYGFAGQLATSFGIYDVINVLREGATVVREFDTALTEMRKVSDETTSSLKNFQNVSFDLADDVGTTAKQIQNSTADWMRIGEALNEASESAETANILKNVSEFESINEATDSLISMSQAYKELEKIKIVDTLNRLGNEYAISTDGLAIALKDSASALKTAQNDFYEASALTTAANTVVQDPSKVGAGLRTISLRLTGTEAARKELEELGEDVSDFQVTTTSKLNQQIMDLTRTQDGLSVSLLDMNGNYRSTYEILLDIAKVWNKIAEEDLVTGENRQNALLEMMAGRFCLKFVETHIYRTHLTALIA